MRPGFLVGLACAGLALALSAPAPPARAGEGIEADRPDLAEGPAALAPRSVQVELGMTRWLLGSTAIGQETLDSVGELLVRVGLATGWEARLGLPTWYRETRANPQYDPAGPTSLETTGLGHVALGVKHDLPSPHPRVETGFIAEASFPVGNESLGEGEPGASLTLAASLDSGAGDWCGNVGLGRYGIGTVGLATLAFERELVKRFSGFAEAAWIAEDDRSSSMAGGGLLWLVADRTQIDVRYGAVFAGGGADPLFGFGLVQRW